MLFTEKELNSCSIITGKNYFNLWIHCDNSLAGEYYDIARKCWSF